MFVVRYLIVCVMVILGVVVWGIAQQHSLLQVIGTAFAACLILQAGVFALVIVMSSRTQQDGSPRMARQRRGLVVLRTDLSQRTDPGSGPEAPDQPPAGW